MTQSDQPHDEPEVTPVGHAGARVEIHERRALRSAAGSAARRRRLIALAVLARAAPAGARHRAGRAGFSILTSLIIVQPGQTKVVRFFGSYVGTVRRAGLWWILPLTDRRNLSIKVRNFETNHLKVNDADGNPVEIACIVVWQVADTARASRGR